MTRKEAHTILTDLLEKRGIEDYQISWFEMMGRWMIKVHFPNRYEKLKSEDVEELNPNQLTEYLSKLLDKHKQIVQSENS